MASNSVILPAVLAPILAGYFIYRMRATARREPEVSPEGRIILRPGGALLWLAVLMLSVTAACIVAPFWDRTLVAAAVIMLPLSGGLGGALLLTVLRERVVLDPIGISFRSMWGGVQTLAWSDVERVSFEKVKGELRIAGAGQSIAFGTLFRGFVHGWTVIQAALPEEQWAPAYAAWEDYARTHVPRAA
jgi:hypothetical protein